MRWQVDLTGAPEVLKILSSGESEFPCVEEKGGKYLLNARLFQECTLPGQVREKASEELFVLNTYAANFLGARGRVRLKHVRSIEPDGSDVVHVRVQEAVAFSETRVKVLVENADGTVQCSFPEPPGAGALEQWRRLIESDEGIRKVERLLSEQAQDWVNLGRIVEVIENDLGGQAELIRQGYSYSKSRSRFGQTANHPESAGDLARHGHNKQLPPADPMDLHEARSYVHGIRRRWLRKKLET